MSEQPSQRLGVDLQGQVAVVTGASRGIGRAIAIALGQAGAKVACVARDQTKLAATAEAIRSADGEAGVFTVDVCDSAAVTAFVDQVSREWGRLDILVNNAGITRDTLVPRMSDEDWDQVIDTNLKSVFLFTRAVTKVMMSQRYGRIINMSSVSGLTGNPGQANYSASKAGILGFTRTVAKELAKRKITVNAICPGFVATEMTEALGPALEAEVKKRVPARRLGTVEDIADATLFLASPAASYITGHVLTVDGGLTS